VSRARRTPRPSLPTRLARVKSEQPRLYRELFSRYSEAIFAIEQDGVTCLEETVDNDVDEEMFDLIGELDKIDDAC
jgi:hypothetical protein